MAKTVELEFEEDGRSFLGGFRQMWFELSNEDGSRHAQVSCGAGMGNPYLYLRIERDGETHYYHTNVAETMRPMIEELLNG